MGVRWRHLWLLSLLREVWKRMPKVANLLGQWTMEEGLPLPRSSMRENDVERRDEHRRPLDLLCPDWGAGFGVSAIATYVAFLLGAYGSPGCGNSRTCTGGGHTGLG